MIMNEAAGKHLRACRGNRRAQQCFALAKLRAGVASEFCDGKNRLVTDPGGPTNKK